jgi:hypothetical protein
MVILLPMLGVKQNILIFSLLLEQYVFAISAQPWKRQSLELSPEALKGVVKKRNSVHSL